MNVPLLRPRVADLVFQLYSRPLHPELFDILAENKLNQHDYQVTVQITRTGHVLAFANAKVFLTEVATSSDVLLPQRRRLLNYRLRGEHNGNLACVPGLQYQTSFQVETLSPEIFRHVHDEIITDGTRRGLLHNFQPNHRLSVAPLGYVALEAKATCLFLSTFHTFPDENTVVKTQSLIEKTASP